MLFDAAKLSSSKRIELAKRVRTLKDLKLPELEYFNSSPCENHDTPNPTCQQCGIIFRKHQRVGVAWLYLAERGLLADSVGTGKTIQAAGTIAAIKEARELDSGKKILVVCRPAAVHQWESQLNRLLKNIKVIVSEGVRAKRVAKYTKNDWDVVIMNDKILINDLQELDLVFDFQSVFVDDIDPLRNGDTATAYAINRITRKSPKVYILTGTPLQKRLHDLYFVLQPLGIRNILGSPITFERRYVQKDLVSEVSSRGLVSTTRKVTGYRNLGEFKDKTAHLTLRRTAEDIEDVSLPAIVPNNVFLELYPAQAEKYNELRQGVLRIIKEEGTTVKRTTALAKIIYGAMICGGLAALGEPDRPRTSIKLDWFENKLTGDLSEDKVVGFIWSRKNLAAMEERLRRQNIKFVSISGELTKNSQRFAAQQEFWNDPECRVLLGTTSIEQSLNLQIANHLVNVDTIRNPSRMEQLAGRIRRDGSSHKTVYVHNLLTVNTQEEGYLPALEREQALIDHIWDSRSELFAALSPLELLQLIGGSSK